jgi:N,N'-diacetyllegionaminate synthase
MTFNILDKRTYIIAEAGVNHNGNYSLAKKLIQKAKNCNADAIKFQIFKADSTSLRNTKMADYQVKNVRKKISQHELLKSLELKKEEYFKLKKIAKLKKIDFLVSVFDETSLIYFDKNINGKVLKIPSGEITNYFLLKKLNLKKYKIILSTGMSNKIEIKNALNLISKSSIYESRNNKIFIKNKKKHAHIKNRIFLLHCVSDYPASENFLNLNCIKTLNEEFGLDVGFSDHTKGISASTTAVALGAKILEKHFTLNRNMNGPDHTSSLDPSQFLKLVREVRRTEIMLGSNIKKLQKCEISNMRAVRKSIVAKKNIIKFEKITEQKLTSKRPGTGISPMRINEFINKASKKNIKKNDLLK